ncbi:MAG: DUF5668 domain-containing protein [Ignavibacteriales bacterium]|nr:DUF5668 domain-containing protein [Ignavibacteriales bacterium]
MKTGKLFWGFFLLTLGALFLLTKYNIFQSSFGFVWDLWPLIFVFWGALVIFKENIVRPVISALFGVFLALLLFGIIDDGFYSFDFSDNDSPYTQFYNEDFDPSIKTADLQINSGAGTFLIGNSTEKLAEGKSKGSFAEYDFESWKDDTSANVQFSLHTRKFRFFRNAFNNHLSIALNEKPVWNITLDVGASKSFLDLTKFKIRNVDIHTGASTTHLKLGDRNDETNVNIEMGAANITIDVPSSTGCEIQSDMALSSKNIHGFESRGDGHYLTENFSSSTKRVVIEIKGGVSSLTVNRY